MPKLPPEDELDSELQQTPEDFNPDALCERGEDESAAPDLDDMDEDAPKGDDEEIELPEDDLEEADPVEDGLEEDAEQED